jgi:hypothetical protein
MGQEGFTYSRAPGASHLLSNRIVDRKAFLLLLHQSRRLWSGKMLPKGVEEKGLVFMNMGWGNNWRRSTLN